MREVIIKTQAELDKLALDQEGYIYIEGGTQDKPLNLRMNFQKAEVIVRGIAYLENVSDSAQIGYVSDSAQIRSVYGSAQIGYVYGSAQIGSVYGSAQIGSVSGSAQIRSVSGSAQIGSVSDSAQIGSVSDSAQIGSVSDSAQIRSVSDSAQIQLFGEAVVSNASSAKKIVCHGYNTVIVHMADKTKIGLVMNKTSHLVVLPNDTIRTKPTFGEYANRYPVIVKGKVVILYKAVHKTDGKYFSDHMPRLEYVVGETKTGEISKQKDDSCSVGLHVSVKYWALNFGASWDDMALLECEVPIKDIIVAKACDGKVRTSNLKVLREVPKEEYWL